MKRPKCFNLNCCLEQILQIFTWRRAGGNDGQEGMIGLHGVLSWW